MKWLLFLLLIACTSVILQPVPGISYDLAQFGLIKKGQVNVSEEDCVRKYDLSCDPIKGKFRWNVYNQYDRVVENGLSGFPHTANEIELEWVPKTRLDLTGGYFEFGRVTVVRFQTWGGQRAMQNEYKDVAGLNMAGFRCKAGHGYSSARGHTRGFCVGREYLVLAEIVGYADKQVSLAAMDEVLGQTVAGLKIADTQHS